MEDKLNEFEKAILEWITTNYNNEQLVHQIKLATLAKRKYTGVGFYVYLSLPTKVDPIELKDVGGHWPLNGPHIKSKDIISGGDSILWGKDGYIDSLEIYSYMGSCAKEITEYELYK
jgi:hypothetical protein